MKLENLKPADLYKRNYESMLFRKKKESKIKVGDTSWKAQINF